MNDADEQPLGYMSISPAMVPPTRKRERDELHELDELDELNSELDERDELDEDTDPSCDCPTSKRRKRRAPYIGGGGGTISPSPSEGRSTR